MNEKIIHVRCKKCNRILKTQRAKERGFGDYCWKQYVEQYKSTKESLLDKILREMKETH